MLKSFIEQTINGLQTGSIYALIALGYTMVYGIVKLINFAHGDILMIGAYTTLIAVSHGMPLIVAIILSMILCAFLGVIIDFFAYRPIRKAPKISALITAIGMSFLLESLALIIFGANPRVIDQKYIPAFLSNNNKISLGFLNISMLTLFVITVTSVCMIALNLFIKKTKLGKATRAVSQDTGAAQLMGINVNKTIAITFALGGALYAIVYPQIEPYMGMLPGLKAFIAAVFGGIGSIPGAMFGGYVLGLLEAYVKGSSLTTWANPIVFGILILILIFRPNGLFGKNTKEKV